MDDEANDAAPWTIKAMPVAVRRRATECAQRRDETVAEWMTRAVNRQADIEAANAVTPPSKSRASTPVALPRMLLTLDLAGLGAAVQATTAAYQAAGLPVPAAIARETQRTIVAHLRAARGLPPRQTGRRNGQTSRLIEGPAAGGHEIMA